MIKVIHALLLAGARIEAGNVTYSVAIILMAAGLYGLVHSWLASLQAKALAQRLPGQLAARFYRLGFNLFAFVSLLPLLALPAVLPDRVLYTIPLPWLLLTSAIQLLAALALLVGVLQTGVLSFLGLAQLFEPDTGPSGLVQTGLYRWVRHPLYTAGLVFIWLTPRMSANTLALYAALSLYILIGAYFEERKLLREFGLVYAEYRRRTPMLIPLLKFSSAHAKS